MPSYAEIAEELCTPAGVASLSTKLQEANQLGATYWVCAVSVNQHASICGLTMLDDVTGTTPQ